MAARDVDVFLIGAGTQLPKTGLVFPAQSIHQRITDEVRSGIIQRAPFEIATHSHANGTAKPQAVAA